MGKDDKINLNLINEKLNEPKFKEAINNLVSKIFEPRINVTGAFLSIDDLIKAETPESVSNLRFENKGGFVKYYDGDKLLKTVPYEHCFYCKVYVISNGSTSTPFNNLSPLSGGAG